MKNFEFEGIEVKTIKDLINLDKEVYADGQSEEYIDKYQLAVEKYLYDALYSIITENDKDYNQEILEYILIEYDYVFDAERQHDYTDLEKSYERGTFIFEVKGKYCSIDFYYSPYNGTVVEFETIKEVQRKARIEYYYE